MSDLSELVRRTADDAPVVPDLVARSHRVAHRRRRRTVVSSVVAVVAVLALAVGLDRGLLPVPRGTAGSPGPAKATGRCATWVEGTSKQVAPAKVAGIGLLTSDQAYALQEVSTAITDDPCAAPAVPLVFRQVGAGERVTAAFTVNGPREGAWSTVGAGPVVKVSVRGTTGSLIGTLPAGGGLSWVDPQGFGWEVEARGLTQAQVVAIADALVLGPTVTLPAAVVPTGLVQLGPVPADPRTQPVWNATYSTQDDPAVGLFQLLVQTGAGWQLDPRLAMMEGGADSMDPRLVTVRGHEAVFLQLGSARSAQALLTWEERPGMWAQVSGAGATLDDLLALASSLRPVSAGDPRLLQQ